MALCGKLIFTTFHLCSHPGAPPRDCSWPPLPLGPSAALSQGVWNQTGHRWGLGVLETARPGAMLLCPLLPGPLSPGVWGLDLPGVPRGGTGSLRCLPPTGRRRVSVESIQAGFRAVAGLQARWRCQGAMDWGGGARNKWPWGLCPWALGWRLRWVVSGLPPVSSVDWPGRRSRGTRRPWRLPPSGRKDGGGRRVVKPQPSPPVPGSPQPRPRPCSPWGWALGMQGHSGQAAASDAGGEGRPGGPRAHNSRSPPAPSEAGAIFIAASGHRGWGSQQEP